MTTETLNPGDQIRWKHGGRLETVEEILTRGVMLKSRTGLFTWSDLEGWRLV